MTSRLSLPWLCAGALAALAPPAGAAQPQPWTPYSIEGQWGGGAPGPAQAAPPATFRSVNFAEATCRKLGVAPPLSFAIPSGFSIQSPAAGQATGECLWGTTTDLARVLHDSGEADFTRLRDGVFRSRLTLDVGYDSGTRKFTFGAGETLESWRRNSQQLGFSNLQLTQELRAGFPVLRLVADAPGGGRVYMLYLGGFFEGSVLLINYYPSLRGRAVDEALWARFVEGIQNTKASSFPRS